MCNNCLSVFCGKRDYGTEQFQMMMVKLWCDSGDREDRNANVASPPRQIRAQQFSFLHKQQTIRDFVLTSAWMLFSIPGNATQLK